MYTWEVDFHMKNGEIIKTKIKSECDNSDSVARQLLLNQSFIGLSSLDNMKNIFINVNEISSFEVFVF